MVVLIADGRAQTAQDIVDQAAKVYMEARTYSVQTSTRDVTAIILPSDTDTPRYEVRNLRYRRLMVKLRRPDDWLLISQNLLDRGNSGEGGAPMERAQVSILMKSGSGAPKQVFYGGSKPANRELPEAQFSGMVNMMLSGGGYSSRSEPDVVLKYFRPMTDSSGNIAFGLVSPQIKDEGGNQGAYCIVAQTTSGQSVTLWIEKTSFLVQRVVMSNTRLTGIYRPTSGFGPPVRAMPLSNMISLSETIYDQKINPPLAGGDFLAIPAGLDRLIVDQMGFCPMTDLIKLAAPPKTAGENPGQPSTTAAVPTPPPVAPAPAVSEQQALSSEQMEGIVLIEGDEGTATGFMTQIKGVDFVVTNQHVLGENKVIKLKNLHGEAVPVIQIFGAVGSDIAILRIAKGKGSLKLAEDVLKSVKIGDKIVVVGNRLGGGVATQTSGQVLGVGPTRIEVNANFEPGNSGSPIFSTGTNEVVGVATYAETRKVAVEESSGYSGSSSATKVDKRWFGYRLDGITKWEQINMERWHAQGERIEKFRDLSEALVAVIRLDWKKAAANERLATLIGDFEARAAKLGSNRVGVADEVKSLIYNVRNLAESGIRDFDSAEYYDYYRTCLYWEESVPMQVDYRKAIVTVLKKYEANSSTYLSKMRNGGN